MQQKTAAASAAVELLTKALSEGHAVVLSLAAPPAVHPAPPVTLCCLAFGMTPSEARVTMALLAHGFVGRDDLRTAMCDGRGAAKPQTVDVVISRVRPKLRQHGVTVETVWGVGYRVNEGGRDRLRRLLADRNVGDGALELKPDTIADAR